MFKSILWLSDSKKQRIDEQVIINLGLEPIYEKLISLSALTQVLAYELCLDTKTILHRQGIMHDFVKNPNLLPRIMDNLRSFSELKARLHHGSDNSHFFVLVNLVITMEVTVECVESLYMTLSDYPLESEGLFGLKGELLDLKLSKEYQRMCTDLSEIRSIFDQIQGVEITVNLTPSQRPKETVVTGVRERHYEHPKAFREVAEILDQNQQFFGTNLKNYHPVFHIGKMDVNILDEMEFAFKKYKPILTKFLNQYASINVEPYLMLLMELTFFEASYGLFKGLADHNLPLCYPKILLRDEKRMSIKDLYNVRTALNIIDKSKSSDVEVVLNDYECQGEDCVFIVTGANRGGKTTFTQAIGQIQILTQLGLPVPAKEASVSIVDSVFTHFPVLEEKTVELGRLGKECQMFSDAFHQATPYSLFLLNESFSSTSYLESLEIATEVVKSLRHRNIRSIFNTHLHELYEETKDLTGIISLVTGREEGKPNFIIRKGEPLGKSYALEIAEKYGVTGQQLMDRRGSKSDEKKENL